ncbi:putative protein [BD1-7 clade bacterium]|uniref:DUF58 domain-containing protein n=1 Tax=BD1-7 clade bacterium TaxID=2029982 RepID=A0A5S9NM41_9GAMM|nr:putative protein [BD1-7 clade bacterium]CAA0094576.1 putative protein [BD1-7 clade bacterium]
MSYQTRSTGAYTELEHLSSYQVAARHLPLIKNNRALAALNGPYKTLIRGRGMEFEDVRQYQPGDDIRTIDWRVSARTGKTHTKQFREEREKPVFIAVDQRSNMFFGSQVALKSVIAADLAAYLAWAAFHKGDRVGGLIFNDQKHTDIRPRRQRKTVLQLLHGLSEFNQALQGFQNNSSRPLADALLELKRIAKPGSQIFVISDFHDLNDSCASIIHDLARHCEIIAIKTYDSLETQLPHQGMFRAGNGQRFFEFNSNDKNTRDQYHESWQAHSEAIRATLGKYQIPLIPVATDHDPLSLLHQYFGKPRFTQIDNLVSGGTA